MTEALTPYWQEADEAVESLVADLVAAAARATDHSARKRPRGRTRPKGTRRHIAEVVRAHQLAPGLRVDRNMVAALLIGHRDLVSNPVLVVAVMQACSLIGGRKLSAKKAARARAASLRVAALISRAEADTYRAPPPRPETVPPLESAAEPALVEPALVDPALVDPALVEPALVEPAAEPAPGIASPAAEPGPPPVPEHVAGRAAALDSQLVLEPEPQPAPEPDLQSAPAPDSQPVLGPDSRSASAPDSRLAGRQPGAGRRRGAGRQWGDRRRQRDRRRRRALGRWLAAVALVLLLLFVAALLALR